MTERYRLSRAGVLNVWQYDDQVFEFADGRLLLRGSNGAGKSKTLEMLLPFVLDGDKARMTASARHHTSLLWLMLDGYSGQNRAGYLWVEFCRGGESVTFGVGVRASQSARSATAWYFSVPGRIGEDLLLEDDAGPLARERLRAALEPLGGHFFDSPRGYKQHVGRTLFGLEPTRYDELLRLLYWLRQPQVGEDIEPARLAEQLVQALPQLDDDAVRAAGDTFDELAAFGEQLDRQRRAADGVAGLAGVYAGYAREVLRGRGAELVERHTERTRQGREVEWRRAESQRLAEERERAETERAELERERTTLGARLTELRANPLLEGEGKLARQRELARERERGADAAERAAARARDRADRSADRVRGDAGALRDDLAGLAVRAREHAGSLARLGAAAPLPVGAAVAQPVLDDAAQAAAAVDALAIHRGATDAARAALGGLRAAVAVVEQAREDLDSASAERSRAETQAAAEEQRAEEERGRLADSRREATRAEQAFGERLATWRGRPHAVPFDAPDVLNAETAAGIAGLARAAAEPVLAAHRDVEKSAGSRRAAAEDELEQLRERRGQVAAERDPAPPGPRWARDPRDPADGAPFWRLVDFATDLGEPERAGIEAALEASGLLDAWVRPDGAVLDGRRRDVVLPLGPGCAPGRATLASVLVPDPPSGAPVTADAVAGLLERVAVGPQAEGTSAASGGSDEEPAQVAPDGRWRLGPLVGAAGKPAAQYVGATAREAERARRLAELDELITVRTAERDEAAATEGQRRAAARALEGWVAEAPGTGELVRAWAALDAREQVARRGDQLADEAERAAAQSRSAEADRRRELAEVAAVHGLPTDAGQLAARREALRDLDGELARHSEVGTTLVPRLRRWAEDALAAAGDRVEADEAQESAGGAREGALEARAAADELEATIAAPVREIRRRIEDGEARDRDLDESVHRLGGRIAMLLADGGAARQAAADAETRLAEHEPVLAEAVARIAAVPDTPGLLASGLGSDSTDPVAPTAPDAGDDTRNDAGEHARGGAAVVGTSTGVFDLARGHEAGDPVPAGVLALARRMAGLSGPERGGTETAVYAAWQDATSGPAGDVDPRVSEIGGALAVIGRDESGEHPIGTLAERLAAAVLRDGDLLTDRERRLFEEHILGDLGESLRTRRIESEELVSEMNTLLRGVTTSQGIAVQLRWSLRDDVAADARRSVELLGRPVGALLPDERRELRDALHRLIEASRADAPEDSYSEHLARALDYRRWFAFRIRYTRPETAGTWHELHRRSPLSQGEQKVVCYLPLFAAAAAHFSSLAGAAPHSPRFVLLDDAFPKIDVRTHPLLFGLLVQLDLDFVITSERLWGDHATVPSLAIYEALRDPTERGIAQYRHTWDGHRLTAVGA